MSIALRANSAIAEWVRYTYDPDVITNMPTDEVQTLTVTATSGTYDLTCLGHTATGISYSATAAQVKSALVSAGVSTNDITVTGGVGGASPTPYTFTFGGAQSGKNVSAMTTDATNLSGGAHTAVVATQTAGGTAVVVHLKDANGKATSLPANCAILRSYIEPVDDLTSNGSATIKLGLDGDDDAFLAATAYSDAAFNDPSGLLTDDIVYVDSGGDKVTATIAAADITGGSFHLHLELRAHS